MLNIKGINLKHALQGAGYNQEKAAKLLGVSRPTLSVWCNKDILNEEILNLVKDKLGIDLTIVKDSDNELSVKKENFGIPMYNFPASASNIEIYSDTGDIKVVGYLNIPGTTKNSFALPVYGHSMYPTLENGSWCVLRPITDPTDILPGEIYYVEWNEYRNFKRLVVSDKDDEIVLWSDNQSEMIAGRPKYSPLTIKKKSIRRLCLLTDILKKPNH